MGLKLNDHELRVLGVLLEKSLTQPDNYPLTLNAIVLGANQKQNRDPVLELTESEVAAALHSLETRQLVQYASTSPGARANRFKHNVVETLHWDRREQAVMAELMLRGRQTPGELRARASRMTPFADLESVAATLAALGSGDPPFVEELPREPGRSANRFRHLLSATDAPAPAVCEPEGGGSAPEPALAERVARLEALVARLEETVESLRRERQDRVDRSDGKPV